MLATGTQRVLSLVLLGVFATPAVRYLDDEKRTHARHATCEHHLRRHHPDPEDRARVLRRAERRQRREQERARAEEARQALLRALQDGDPQAIIPASDPLDDDIKVKKGRRKSVTIRNDWSLKDAPRIRPTGDFLAMLRTRVDVQRACRRESAETLPHFGSGPCHSIPRPREGTIDLALQKTGVLA